MRKISRFLSFLLVLTLIIPGFTFAQEQPNIDRQKQLVEKAREVLKNEIAESKKTSKAEVELEKEYNDDEEVRVIVELEANPSIVYATERGMTYDEMSISAVADIERNLEREQEAVKQNISNNRIDMEYINSFKTVFNGFSGNVKYGDIARIERLKSVKSVTIATEYEMPVITPDMKSSHEMIGSYDLWNTNKFKGEGTVIAILDSGIDWRHQDLVLSETTDPKLTKEIVESKDLLGKYFTEKVPYGYNYYDKNDEVIHLGPNPSMHGMHVAGTAAANGDVENGGIKGVAPEAQLLAMKVFSNDPIYATTFGDVYVVAIEESVRLGVDVINMSLGSTASFYVEGNPEGEALKNAVDNGIVCAISAGNSDRFGNGFDDPWKENPDTGVVGSPSLNPDSLSVASIENLRYPANYLTVNVGGVTKEIVMTIAGASANPASVFNGEVEYVDCQDGSPQYLTGVAGKVALIVRGGATPNFVDKIANAMAAGAAGVIVRNHVTGGEGLISMATPPGLNIPAVFVGYKGGLDLLNAEVKKVTFPKGDIEVANPAAGLMSNFTSWGTTPSLELKPEITAPGGMIYSTVNDGKYEGGWSGTSMAAPHVAGGSALVLQYLKQHDEYKNLSLGEQARLAKVFLMNTATPVLDKTDTLYSPRRQGAGLMNLSGAVNTEVRLVNAATDEAKVELKDFEATKFTMNLKAINDSDAEVTYLVDVAVLADNIEVYEGQSYITNARNLNANVTVVGGNEIVIPANSSKEFTVKVDFTYAAGIYKNMFVEGFVTLTDNDDENPSLVLPYVGFHGEWDEPAILDGMWGVDGEENSFYGESDFLNFKKNGNVYWYGYNEFETAAKADSLYISPGNYYAEEEGTGALIPYLTFLRNAEKVSYNVLDKEGNLLRTMFKQLFVRKNYHDGRYAKANLVRNAMWDGSVKGQIVPDGEYIYEIAANVHYEGAKTQSKKINVTVDTTGPALTDVKFDPETGKVTWKATDAGSGLFAFFVYVNDKYDIVMAKMEDGKVVTDYELDITPYLTELGANTIEVVGLDNLFNDSYEAIEYVTDNGDAYIFLHTPDLLVAYNEPPVLTNPQIIEELPINSILVDDKAYDQAYAVTNTMAQLHILFNDYLGNPIYVKTSRTEAMDLRGNTVDLGSLPSTYMYYDADGVITQRQTLVVDPEILEGVGVRFSGYVANFAALDKVLVDGVEADFAEVEYVELKDGSGNIVYTGPAYLFELDLRLEDGYKETVIEAISKTGAKSSIVRRYWVDNAAPTLDINVLERDPSSAKATIEVTMTDRYGFVELFMDDNHVFIYDETFQKLDTKPANETFTIEVNVEEGDNTFQFTVYDIAGNRTVKEITITRTAE